jgi:hypothetical protein
VASQASSDERLGTWRGGRIWGPGSGVRCERGVWVSSGITWGQRARAAAGEWCRARWVAGRQRGKRGRERGGWWVG